VLCKGDGHVGRGDVWERRGVRVRKGVGLLVCPGLSNAAMKCAVPVLGPICAFLPDLVVCAHGV
jgi:hypothetical protein